MQRKRDQKSPALNIHTKFSSRAKNDFVKIGLNLGKEGLMRKALFLTFDGAFVSNANIPTNRTNLFYKKNQR